MRKLLVLTAIVLLYACDKAKENTQTESNPIEANSADQENPNQLSFVIDLETDKPEAVRLFSNDIFLNNKQSLSIGVSQRLSSEETSKIIEFTFPEEIKPDYNLYFSFGTKLEKTVTVKSITMSFGEKEISLATKELPNYFLFNKFIDYDEENGVITTKKVDGQHNPLMWLRRKHLNDLIQ